MSVPFRPIALLLILSLAAGGAFAQIQTEAMPNLPILN